MSCLQNQETDHLYLMVYGIHSSLCVSLSVYVSLSNTHTHTQTKHLLLFVDIHICILKASVICVEGK